MSDVEGESVVAARTGDFWVRGKRCRDVSPRTENDVYVYSINGLLKSLERSTCRSRSSR